VIQLKQLFGSI